MSEHITENFKEYLSKFKFSTAPDHISSRVPTTATPQKLVVDRKVSPSTSRKRKRKVFDASPSKSPAKKLKRGYAPPEKYAHLAPLTDYLAYGLDGV